MLIGETIISQTDIKHYIQVPTGRPTFRLDFYLTDPHIQ